MKKSVLNKQISHTISRKTYIYIYIEINVLFDLYDGINKQ